MRGVEKELSAFVDKGPHLRLLRALGVVLALAFSMAKAPQERDQSPQESLPIPLRAVVTEQVFFGAILPKSVLYSVHVPLGAFRDYLRSLLQGRDKLLKAASTAGRKPPPSMTPEQSSTPSLALVASWGAIEGKLEDTVWVMIDFELTLDGKPENLGVLVIERSKGSWSSAAESDEVKKALKVIHEECPPKVLKPQNFVRGLLVSARPAVGDHFPADAKRHLPSAEGYCWQIVEIREGSYLGQKGTVYTLKASSWNREGNTHVAVQEQPTRTYLGGVGLVEAAMGKNSLRVVEILDPGKAQGVTTLRETWIEVIRRFGEGLKNRTLTDDDLSAGIGYVMELLPGDAEELQRCIKDRRVARDKLEKAMVEILKSLDRRTLIRSDRDSLQSHLSR